MLANPCNEIYLGPLEKCVLNMRTKTSVHRWRFDDGIKPINPGNLFGESFLPRGWYCWVYPQDDYEFVTWMSKNCPGAEVTHRFNNGNPMHTVYIPNDQEAAVFQLRWA